MIIMIKTLMSVIQGLALTDKRLRRHYATQNEIRLPHCYVTDILQYFVRIQLYNRHSAITIQLECRLKIACGLFCGISDNKHQFKNSKKVSDFDFIYYIIMQSSVLQACCVLYKYYTILRFRCVHTYMCSYFCIINYNNDYYYYNYYK